MSVVTALKATKRGRVALYVDGEFTCTVSEALLARYRLFVGRELSADELAEVAAEAATARALGDAYRLLGHRARSRAELAARLAAKGHSPALIETVLTRLQHEALIDDEAFARAFIADKRRLSQWGRERIARELARAGVSEATIDAALAETSLPASASATPNVAELPANTPPAADDALAPLSDTVGASAAANDEAEYARALAALRRRGRPAAPLEAAKARAFGFLRRRGYDLDTTYRAINAWVAEHANQSTDET